MGILVFTASDLLAWVLIVLVIGGANVFLASMYLRFITPEISKLPVKSVYIRKIDKKMWIKVDHFYHQPVVRTEEKCWVLCEKPELLDATERVIWRDLPRDSGYPSTFLEFLTSGL